MFADDAVDENKQIFSELSHFSHHCYSLFAYKTSLQNINVNVTSQLWDVSRGSKLPSDYKCGEV